MLSYVLDARDHIVEIKGPWDEFAASNDCPGLTRSVVLGRSLFDFVSADDAREVVSLLLARVRTAGPLDVGFRCDAPALRRFMRLELRPEPQSHVRSTSHVVREEGRPAQPLLDRALPRTGSVLMICSWCKKVLVRDGWSEIEEAAEELGFLEADVLPQLSHGICPPCRAAFSRP